MKPKISSDTRSRLCRIFETLAEGEAEIEEIRSQLISSNEYDPLLLMKYLDQGNKNYLTDRDIIDFLLIKGVQIKEIEAQMIILFYDQDYDRKLGYNEVIPFFQNRDYKKPINSRPFLNEIPEFLDFPLTKLLEKETELARKLIFLLGEIQVRGDFKIHSLYHLLKDDLNSNNTITKDSLKNFFKSVKSEITDENAERVIKRMDLNGDDKVDLVETHGVLGFPDCKVTCLDQQCPTCDCKLCGNCESDVPCFKHGVFHQRKNPYNKSNAPSNKNKINKNYSPPKNENNINNNPRISPSLNLRPSPKRQYSPTHRVRGKYQINPNCYIPCNCCVPCPPCCCRECGLYPCQCCPVCHTNPCECCRDCGCFPCQCYPNEAGDNVIINNEPENKKDPDNKKNKNKKNNSKETPPLSYEEFLFVNYLEKLMFVESQLEREKINLIMNCDFNIEDAFRLFEKSGKSYLTKKDLINGLKALGLTPDKNDVTFLMKRFDLSRKKILNYSDFFDMLVPFERQFRSEVETRGPCSCCCEKNTFCKETIFVLANLIKLMIRYEKKLEGLREGMKRVRKNLEDVMGGIDVEGRGGFQIEDLKQYVIDNDLFTNDKDFDLMFIRLDKNRNGVIDYDEVMEEITPSIEKKDRKK